MIALRKMTQLAPSIQGLSRMLKCEFSNDKWKDRDEASEKVYITQQEKELMRKLYKKVEAAESQPDETDAYERKLRETLKKHKITNEALVAELLTLFNNFS